MKLSRKYIKPAIFVLIALLIIIYLNKKNSNFNGSNIQGTDSNSNGVRDDVEEIIVNESKKSKKLKAALIQLAIAVQKAIETPLAALEINKDVDKAMDCLSYIFPDFDEYDRLSSIIEAETTNNAARAEAYLQYNLNLSGFTFYSGTADKNSCNFDVDSLEN